MLSQTEYSIFKQYLNKFKSQLSKEYMIDILLLLRPKKIIKQTEEQRKSEEKNIGLIIIKIDKILSQLPELNESYLKSETIRLFKLIWNDNDDSQETISH